MTVKEESKCATLLMVCELTYFT